MASYLEHTPGRLRLDDENGGSQAVMAGDRLQRPRRKFHSSLVATDDKGEPTYIVHQHQSVPGHAQAVPLIDRIPDRPSTPLAFYSDQRQHQQDHSRRSSISARSAPSQSFYTGRIPLIDYIPSTIRPRSGTQVPQPSPSLRRRSVDPPSRSQSERVTRRTQPSPRAPVPEDCPRSLSQPRSGRSRDAPTYTP
ncbi:hypothetical protein BDV95DRAFT_594844 [Massariosphaeria phaeospora]|uniref:Uncharacterized protein n=1 Tax=Massariosphaeria phaeospora TaxID=100035 RepID=A0A7C8IE09_9PLEO|nr:hypothetical protein BDV95DRAFT_594844 [Massariosphaeria phaeospora]